MDVQEVINSLSVDMGSCGNCKTPVITTPFKSGLVHANDFMKGCRAASFSVANGWNDEIPKAWNAKLIKE